MEKNLSRVIGGLSLLKVGFMYQKEEQRILDNAIRLLKEREPVRVWMEGGGHSWWYVCGECHTAINPGDKFCRECGRPLIWEESNRKGNKKNEPGRSDDEEDPDIE